MSIHRCICGRETAIDAFAPGELRFCPACGVPVALPPATPQTDAAPERFGGVLGPPRDVGPGALPVTSTRMPGAARRRAPPRRTSSPAEGTRTWLLRTGLFALGSIGTFLGATHSESSATSGAPSRSAASGWTPAAARRPAVEVLSTRRATMLATGISSASASTKEGFEFLIVHLRIPSSLVVAASETDAAAAAASGDPDADLNKGMDHRYVFTMDDFRVLDDQGFTVATATGIGQRSGKDGRYELGLSVSTMGMAVAHDEDFREELVFVVPKGWKAKAFQFRSDAPVTLAAAD